MDARLDIVTLGVGDLEAARTFYRDGLGWEPILDIDEVIFFQVGHGRLLSLFGAADLEADVAGPGAPAPATPGAGVTLAQVVATEEEVHAIAERFAAAGGTVLKAPQRADFGGFHAYVADPSGFRWEIATNPGFAVAGDGRVVISEIGAG